MHAITLPSFAHHVGQSVALSYHPTSSLHQFHPPTQSCTTICLIGIMIDSDWSVFWWCRHNFAETTPSKLIHHGEVLIIEIPPSQLTYCPVFIALLPSRSGTQPASFSQWHCMHRALIYSSGNSLFAFSPTSKGISYHVNLREVINLRQYA